MASVPNVWLKTFLVLRRACGGELELQGALAVKHSVSEHLCCALSIRHSHHSAFREACPLVPREVQEPGVARESAE